MGAAAVERRPFGGTGQLVSTIGQGTWQLRDARRAAQALRLGLELGMTHLDTAELYRGSEEVLREAVRGFPRQELWLVSKVLPRNASYEGTLRACDASLRRLGTPTLDAYLLHWWEPSVRVEDTMRAMGELIDAGKVRFAGVSNLGIEELEVAQDALGERHRVVCDQVLYHLGERGVEHELLPYCAQRGIAVVAYSPYGAGAGGFPRPGSPGYRVLAEVGKAHGKTPRQVALRFLTRHASVFTIPKSEEPEHVRENAGGAGWGLRDEDVQALEAAFPLPPRDRPLAML